VAPAHGPPDRAPDDAGDLAQVPPILTLFQLVRGRATGLLAFRRGASRKDVYMRDGELVGVWSNAPDDQFGSYLVGNELVSEGELAMALALVAKYGSKLGDTLIRLGLIRPVEMFRQLNRYARARIVEPCTWTSGRFAWYRGHVEPRDGSPLDLDGLAVIGAIAKEFAPGLVEPWLTANHSTRLHVPHVHIDPDRFGIEGLGPLLDRLDGATAIGKLVDRRRSGAQQLHLARTLYLVATLELAVPVTA
jgi:hypothetical protein